MAPRNQTSHGSYKDVRDDLKDVVAHTTPGTDAHRGRVIALALVDSLEGVAKDSDLINVNVTSTVGATGQIDLSASASLYPGA